MSSAISPSQSDKFNLSLSDLRGISGLEYRINDKIEEIIKEYTKKEELLKDTSKQKTFLEDILYDFNCDEERMIKAAKEFPEVEFCHATGTQAKQSNLANYHNAFASIYEGRYLAGYAAGLKLLTMTNKAVDNNFHVGYVGAFPYAEVKSGYTSWFLGRHRLYSYYGRNFHRFLV